MYYRIIFRSITIILFCSLQVLKGQISNGGYPPSLKYNLTKSEIQTIEIQKPDLKQIFLEDAISDKKGEAYRMGVLLPVNKNTENSGSWTVYNNYFKIWRLRITSKEALALSLYFNNFYLPKGSELFIYNDEKTQIIGAFTCKNNSKTHLFATELITGDAINLEYVEKINSIDRAVINISEINYAYRGISFLQGYKYGFGSSGSCEVNVNCSEGINYAKEKAGVVRINVRVGGSSKWCTGSLLNNTSQDYKPYLLTADHCEIGASVNDINQWVFYFNYEAPSCNNPPSEGNLASQSMTGAVKLSSGGDGGNSGSDFLLLLLNENIPESYNPYFLGWDRSEDSSLFGCSIHHPAGDLKKISSYSTPLQTSYWTNSTILSHWKVLWQATANGYGVTEGGSSGSPIFNNTGKIIGTLTGGDSQCSNVTGPDYYGKFNWHWNKNGSSTDKKLDYWLDPIGTNLYQINGTSYAKIDFTANKTVAKIGEPIDFIDKSLGGPYIYNWVFKYASPSNSSDQNPKGIVYSETGFYDINLTITSADTMLTLLKRNYVQIWDDIKIFYNQYNQKIFVDLKNNKFKNIKIQVFNSISTNVDEFNFNSINENLIEINAKNYINGVYIVRVITENITFNQKILKIL